MRKEWSNSCIRYEEGDVVVSFWVRFGMEEEKIGECIEEMKSEDGYEVGLSEEMVEEWIEIVKKYIRKGERK